MVDFKLRNEPRLDLKQKAFDYQLEAVDFVVSREYSAIFHEQGLGKTKIAIDVAIRWLAEKAVDTILVFTKKSLVANWQREFVAHSYLKPAVLGDSKRSNYYVITTPTRLVLAHFEVAKSELERLKLWLRTRRVGVIVDEAAKIKNPDSDLTQAFFDLGPLFTRRVIMTGTPVANRPYDVWAQIYFLDQGKTLGTDFPAFKRETDLTRELGHDAAGFETFQRKLEEVNESLKSLSVRETKAGGRISLPGKEYRRIETQWEHGQAELYRQVKEDLRAIVVKDGKLIEDEQESLLKRLLRLVQVASNPILIDESYAGIPGKFQTLEDLVQDIVTAGEKVIVWTTFNENCEWLTKNLRRFGSLALHGKLPMDRRNAVVNWFLTNPDDRVLVATPGAAKEGLTLTVANHVVFYDRTYSLDDYLQAQDRIHRVSQVKTCYVYNLIMQDSIDEWIDALIDEKRHAAQLAQGDITREQYAQRATMSMFDVLQQILT
jgi:SNF2 family DNA or RNA helicase